MILDFGSHEVVAVDLEGNSEVITRVPGMPMGLGFLPDGNPLVVSARDGRLFIAEPGGRSATYADLTGLAGYPRSDRGPRRPRQRLRRQHRL